ncbi:hypothetical protein GLOIN_2v1488499 [Rhizophagus clarus]|uniref:Uncharacterized protein n=1 Tax=Rhizophagus clarus TaxID=94130 RepID=A0A8H3QEN5_9GLOM|nr:hypothetical protein GLOIN_2v1488499 [Rhizophagus clarus]
MEEQMLQYLASALLFNGMVGTARAFNWTRNWKVNEEESKFIRNRLLQPNVPFSGKGTYLYERSWQMEWFLTVKTVVPENASISADVGASFGSVGFLG